MADTKNDEVVRAEYARTPGVEVVRRPDGSQVMVIPDPPEGDQHHDPNFKHTPRPKEGVSLGFPSAP
jgi:hypothetical protein